MELDELKQAWQALDRRLQQQNTLQLESLRTERAGRVTASLRPLALGQLVQIAFGIAMIAAGTGLWTDAGDNTLILLCGIALHLYGIATGAAAGIVLFHVARIDRTLPVVELQRRLVVLRRAHIIGGRVAGLPWWVLWLVPPALIYAVLREHGAIGGMSAWLMVCTAIGVAALIATWGLLRWLRRPGNEALAARVEDAEAGGSLRRAQAELDALDRFMDEAA